MKETATTIIDASSNRQDYFSSIKIRFDHKQQLLRNLQEHCLRSVDSVFNEVTQDFENLRQESLAYVKQQFHDANVSHSNTIHKQ
jgi:hypothetical protein